jgi:hypothetical protein
MYSAAYGKLINGLLIHPVLTNNMINENIIYHIYEKYDMEKIIYTTIWPFQNSSCYS